MKLIINSLTFFVWSVIIGVYLQVALILTLLVVGIILVIWELI
jgi:hypothetical protein